MNFACQVSYEGEDGDEEEEGSERTGGGPFRHARLLSWESIFGEKDPEGIREKKDAEKGRKGRKEVVGVGGQAEERWVVWCFEISSRRRSGSILLPFERRRVS